MEEPERHPAILASDAEREHTVALLRDAVVDGRLTLEEFGGRVEAAQGARTDQELALLCRDLPAVRARSEPAALAEHDRHLAFCSRLERRGPWELPSRSEYRSLFGTIDLDLSQARLAGDDSQIDVWNLFGTVTVIVPEGVDVTISGGGLFASQVIDPPAVSRIAGAPRLRIRASGPGGTLYVRHTRRESGLLGRLLGKD